MIPIVAFTGPSKSGKTTLIEGVVSQLSSKGLAVGTIKHTRGSDLSIDVEGKDTWRYAQAGAKIVVGIAAEQVVMLKKQTYSYRTIDEILNLVGSDVDVVIIEGFRSLIAKRSDILKVILVKSKEDLNENLKEMSEPMVAIVGPGLLRRAVPKGKSSPFFDIDNEKEKAIQLITRVAVNALEQGHINDKHA